MPEMSGVEFLMQVMEIYPDAKIIGMSGGGMISAEGVLDAARSLGAVEVLSKPLDLDDLERTVESALALPAPADDSESEGDPATAVD